jgi:hypothetical protein
LGAGGIVPAGSLKGAGRGQTPFLKKRESILLMHLCAVPHRMKKSYAKVHQAGEYICPERVVNEKNLIPTLRDCHN